MADERFPKIEDEYFLLRGQLETGRITHAQFEAALKEMMFQDAQGRYWMIGAESGKWYLHDGTKWVEADPNAATAPPPTANLPSPPPVTPVPSQNKTRASGGRRILIIGSVLALCICIGIALGVGINQGFLNVDLASVLGLKPPTRIVVVVPFSTDTSLPSATGTSPTQSSASAVPSSTTTLPPQSSPTILASTAANPPPSPTVTPTPLSTLPPPASRTTTATPLPTNSPTSSFMPGVYVTKLRTDPAQPKRNQGVTFIATFVNTTGATLNYDWLIQIYDPSNPKKSIGESAVHAISVPVGTTVFRSADNWTENGPGGCVDLYAQAKYRNPDNSRVAFNNTDGSVVSFGFQVCP